VTIDEHQPRPDGVDGNRRLPVTGGGEDHGVILGTAADSGG
jgi:hypothetical protein